MASENIKNVFIINVHGTTLSSRTTGPARRQGYESCQFVRPSSKPNEAQNPDLHQSQILAPRIQWAGGVIVLISQTPIRASGLNWEIDTPPERTSASSACSCAEPQDSDSPRTSTSTQMPWSDGVVRL